MYNIEETLQSYNQEFLTVNEVGDILRLGRDKTKKVIHSNGFPYIKLGSTIRIPKKEFVKWYQKMCYSNHEV